LFVTGPEASSFVLTLAALSVAAIGYPKPDSGMARFFY
jgi:hypothetical protein